ncbi:ATP-binding protein [Cohnella cholangitidis]|uniref:histidine kinase n=1 Tax=Cohnella cholangitidis TaxID=2598458 RepID=A0A7G5C035_9BACL|nr:ATP-binding protein [Cohnella cholangitidis]QMV42569.1 histidine kinase [Cohnella cholangitidis]
MSRWTGPFRRSITKRFTGMMIMLLVIVLAGAAVIYWNDQKFQDEYRVISDKFELKQKSVTGITEHMNEVFYRSIGFYVLLDDNEYNLIFLEKMNLERALSDFKKLALDDEETAFVQRLERFLNNYFDNKLPEAVKYARNDDKKNLRQLFASELKEQINMHMRDARSLQQKYETELMTTRESFVHSTSEHGVKLIFYVLGILAVSVIVTFLTARDFGIPLSKLAARAKLFVPGQMLKIEYTDRQDEIGGLARSLESMMYEIQYRAEELLSQNEELHAQQDELQMQQEELTRAIGNMEDNEQKLRKRNDFVQSLASTLDRRELLQSIIYNMVHFMNADKGVIIRLNADRDYAAFGLPEAAIQRFLATADEGMITRVRMSKLPFTLKRPATPAESGYHLELNDVSDIYIPVLNSGGEVFACVVLTRLGLEMTPKEESEARTYAKQISLSLDKLDIYEKAERQRQMMQNTLNTLHEGIHLVDQEGMTVLVNSKWHEMMGEEAGRGWKPTLEQYGAFMQPHVKDPIPFAEFIADMVGGQETEARSITYEWTGEARRIVQMYYEPLYQRSDRIGTLFVHRDITKEYEMDQMKSELVSTVSHELRTPLASVLGFAELLLHKELSPERQKKYIGTIHQEATRLTSLISDFLDLQRMESGRQMYEFKKADVAPLIQEVIELHQVNAPNHRFVWLPASQETQAIVDIDRIKQVLMNVIGNAVKYSPNGGEITVACSVESRTLRIDITDQGLGIPQEALAEVFNKFYRVDNSDRREIGGTGLGLSIVKEIMDNHDGKVEVSSIYGQGSTFSLSLPLATGNRNVAGYERSLF